MTDITKKISHLIESQFPAHYRDSGEELVAFIKAYYEFLESTDKYSVKMSKQMFDLIDIDESLDSFVLHFQNTYLAEFPSIVTSDKRFAIKHIMDLYSSKGSKNSLELLMRLLYSEEADVYYPAVDILKPSDSSWVRPRYIEVTKTARSRTLLNKQISGVRSGAKAFVESVITKRVDGKLIDILYLSSIDGQFIYDEKITDDGVLKDAPTVIGSLTSLNITLGGRDNKVGDILDVVTPQAKHGKVRVAAVKDSTGKVDFSIADGGFGYTSAIMPGTSDIAANGTKIYVSTALLSVNNQANSFIIYEPVLQRIEKVYLGSATIINSNTTAVGRYLIGKNSVGAQVANGTIIAVANTDANGDVINAASANSLVTVQLIGDTTFSTQSQLTLSSSVALANKEYIDEESAIVLTVASNTGFSSGTNVYQEVRDPVSNTVVSRSIGVVNTSTSSTITLKEAWGTFVIGRPIYKVTSTAVNTAVSGVTVSSLGARGLITSISGTDITVKDVSRSFTIGKKIRGSTTKRIGTISSIDGAINVYLNANNSANAIIFTPAGKDSVAKLYANGIIVGQNSTTIGIYGNTYPFYYSNTGSYYIETDRESMISPPRYANNVIIDLNVPILGIKGGSGASFKIGYLENTETIQLNTDTLGSNNTTGIPFKQVLLSGKGTGIGFVANVSIINGGTLYSNGGNVTFTGGGLDDGDPWNQASGYITTDDGGTITSITLNTIGEGYYGAPTISLPLTAGVVANVSVNMNYGYGFSKNPSGDSGSIISDLLTSENFLIGTIGTLTRINPGANYTADPFVRVYNPYIASYSRGDVYLRLTDISGSFKTGETIEQVIGIAETAKGTVISYNADTSVLNIQRTSFNIAFVPGIAITGVTSDATATILSVYRDVKSQIIGDNADISANVVVANGVATSVEVIDSGFGYIKDGSVTLESANNLYVMAATTNVLNNGIGQGYWTTTSSHLNSEKKIHDNKYYQEYSYEIISGISLNKYKGVVNKILHVAGNELFGAVEKRSNIDLTISAANAVITIS